MNIPLHTLLQQVGLVCDKNLMIEGIQSDSRKIKNGHLFVALSGHESDGHEYIKQAYEQGALAVVGERELEPQIPIPYFHVPNARESLPLFSSIFYKEPHKKHKIIGITGTNGKTTTAHIIRHILSENGKTTSLFGTVGYHLNGVEYESTLTTPDAITIQQMLHESKDEYVVMEVSSHGLDQFRVSGQMFDYGIFTNLSHDHLDYHVDLENYYQAKKRLFSCLKKEGKAIIGTYNSWGERLHAELAEELIPAIPFGDTKNKNLIFLKEYTPTPNATFVINDHETDYKVHLKMTGVHNIFNAVGSYLCTRDLGLAAEDIISALESFEGAPGRFDIIKMPNEAKAIIDYAHTPDGLLHALTTAKQCIENDLIHVFGFRGGRDTSKRKDMLDTSSRLSRQVILTLDDLNGVEEESMLKDLHTLSKSYSNVQVIADRTEAIENAVHALKADDGLIVTGKGPEKYKESYRHPTQTDRETILNVLEESSTHPQPFH
ncbi:UDP-N-acetylmuramoyl-L-alanyl-D-glutamate--2,6-diaminopimelate ligase [Bacillus solitudinis]|uniref:UDP-N-acetylmuramoyl-L-alanyl-D-glutamate--2, 6-diaminopimelate ligase n=1 Tax=Bacillus solitudinis TaxID=2014074 RepID=UPI0012FD223E|nr:UDP-N-acetylmuramoyl-L-alanyl-D-glutamate--2,6-diaminopimelate ligase [Bacillus solitudinis]